MLETRKLVAADKFLSNSHELRLRRLAQKCSTVGMSISGCFALAPRFRPDRPVRAHRQDAGGSARRTAPSLRRRISIGWFSQAHTGAVGRKAAGAPPYVVSILLEEGPRMFRKVALLTAVVAGWSCLPWRSHRCRRCRFLHYQCRKERRRSGQPARPMYTNSAVPTCRIRCAYWHACRPIGRRSARLATGCWSATANELGRGWPRPVPRIRSRPIRTWAFL
jgi:hypothetical protein